MNILNSQFRKLSFVSVISATLILFSCKKSDSIGSTNPPPVTLADSGINIIEITRADINNVSIRCAAKPPAPASFYNLKLYWSVDTSFAAADSTLLSAQVSTATETQTFMKRLKQATTYYTRLGVTFKDKIFYSPVRQFSTDTLKLLYYPKEINRGVVAQIRTSFDAGTAINDTSVRIYLNDVSYSYTNIDNSWYQFTPPANMAPGKYALRFERNGLSITASDSLLLPPGKWEQLVSPVFPVPPGYSQNGLGYYGSCFSNQNGYILPGRYYHQFAYPDPNYLRPSYLLQFNGTTKQWTQREPAVKKYFEMPVCQYDNGYIYVFAGFETDQHNSINLRILNTLRLNVNTLEWSTLSANPYPSAFNQVSFKINDDIYVGLGADGNNMSPCCGVPLPYKKLWKYNSNNDTWSAMADIPYNHELNGNYPTAFTIGSQAYIFYGYIPVGDPVNPSEIKRELYRYDAPSNTWSTVPLPPESVIPKGEKYQVAVYNNKAYFFSGQARMLGSYYYYYAPVFANIEFDPATGVYKKIATGPGVSVTSQIFQNGNKFYFQSNVVGYIEYIDNKTFEFTVE